MGWPALRRGKVMRWLTTTCASLPELSWCVLSSGRCWESAGVENPALSISGLETIAGGGWLLRRRGDLSESDFCAPSLCRAPRRACSVFGAPQVCSQVKICNISGMVWAGTPFSVDDGYVAHRLILITRPLLDSAELYVVLGIRVHAMAAVLLDWGDG